MNQLKFFKLLVWILLAINLAIVSFLIVSSNKSRPEPPRPQRTGAVELLNLDGKQHELFMVSAKKHGREISEVEKQQKKILEAYFSPLTNEKTNVPTDSLIVLLQEIEKTKVELTMTHFQEIKAILRPEQNANFQRFMDHVLKSVIRPDKKRRPPPRDIR